MMKAVVYQTYGTPDVLTITGVDKPMPKAGEVLIAVQATALNYADGALLKGQPFLARLQAGLFKPKNKILGADVAGRVEAVGKGVTAWQVGDEVFGDLSGCGWGGLAEYVTARADILVHKPANITFVQAAATPMAAVTALQGLRTKGQIQSGQRVLINGASGGVGTFAVQIAKALGAEVTAVCSTRNMDRIRSLGADHAIDYTQEDFTQNGQQYDLILAVNGDRSLADYQRSLAPEGIYVCSGGSMKQIFQSMLGGSWQARGTQQTMTNLMAVPNQDDLTFVSQLLETGQVVPVIDKSYPLEEAASAFRYLSKGHAQGKIVMTIPQ